MNNTKNRRILVVDDNPAIHDDFRKILGGISSDARALTEVESSLFDGVQKKVIAEGFEIDCAFQGQAGLEKVRQALVSKQPYALAFIDVRMPPGWDGIETTAEIWRIDPDIQIVICTAFSDYSWDKMNAKLGVSDRLVILKKPFDNVEVLQLAQALTEKWQLHQRAELKTKELEAMVAARTHELQTAYEQLKAEMAERAKTEEALRQSQKMDSLGQLAGGIAHDFNNLLTVIRGYVECLIAEGQQVPATLEVLQEIDGAAKRAAKLTSQMLLFSRKKRMELQPLDLNQLLAQFGKMLRQIIGEDIALEFKCDGRPLVINADPVMIEQVVLNLAVNARDAMPRGGQFRLHTDNPEITEEDPQHKAGSRPRQFARISVSDTGGGIAPEVMPHIFEPFYTTKDVGKGTGLGLATVYGIVKQHQGWIEVDSEPGLGTNFRIFLPLVPCGVKPGIVSSSSSDAMGGNETILLVEDEMSLRQLALKVLRRHGYHVYEAASGVEALSVWREHGSEINLVLTDMVMPGGVSGRELAEKLRFEKSDLKIAFTTGYSVDAIGQSLALEEGLNFLAKPYDMHKLALTVRRCLDEPAQLMLREAVFCAPAIA
jgi:two-component system NtrC family sensor kinase